eukprot:325547-Chlamydomonas_euryale.AAC.5
MLHVPCHHRSRRRPCADAHGPPRANPAFAETSNATRSSHINPAEHAERAGICALERVSRDDGTRATPQLRYPKLDCSSPRPPSTHLALMPPLQPRSRGLVVPPAPPQILINTSNGVHNAMRAVQGRCAARIASMGRHGRRASSIPDPAHPWPASVSPERLSHYYVLGCAISTLVVAAAQSSATSGAGPDPQRPSRCTPSGTSRPKAGRGFRLGVAPLATAAKLQQGSGSAPSPSLASFPSPPPRQKKPHPA